MALKFTFLALLVYCASEAQSQGDDTSLPLTYNATEIQGDGATCPNDQLRQAVQQNISTDVRNRIQNIILPLIQPTSPVPQCPCLSGGATRIAYLDMTDPNQQCPPAWQEITSPARSCGRRRDGVCDSVFYPSNGITYSRVCGRIIAFQFCSPEAFYQVTVGQNTIDSLYVDGVSITHGSPRQHVWTFASATQEENLSTGQQLYVCPCNNAGAPIQIPSFVGNDYFCDSGTTGPAFPCPVYNDYFFEQDPLWDGEGCGPSSTCCEFNNPPWFCKTLPQPTTDDIEVRICSAQTRANEDTPIQQLEIYVS